MQIVRRIVKFRCWEPVFIRNPGPSQILWQVVLFPDTLKRLNRWNRKHPLECWLALYSGQESPAILAFLVQEGLTFLLARREAIVLGPDVHSAPAILAAAGSEASQGLQHNGQNVETRDGAFLPHIRPDSTHALLPVRAS